MPRNHSKLSVIQFQVTFLASGLLVAEPSKVPTCCFFISPDDASSIARALSEGLLKLVRPTRNLDFSSSNGLFHVRLSTFIVVECCRQFLRVLHVKESQPA